jgi:hypothetical protein
MNAKKEFLEHLTHFAKSKSDVLCAKVRERNYKYNNLESAILTTGWTEDDFEKFLDTIDFDYDEGYGSQELFGMIWFKDGTWSERQEYDGAESWDYKRCPDIPKELIRKDKEREIKLKELGL